MGLPVISTNWSGITAYLHEGVGYPVKVADCVGGRLGGWVVGRLVGPASPPTSTRGWATPSRWLTAGAGGWAGGWAVCWRAGWLVSWLVGRLVGPAHHHLLEVGWLVGWLVGWYLVLRSVILIAVVLYCWLCPMLKYSIAGSEPCFSTVLYLCPVL